MILGRNHLMALGMKQLMTLGRNQSMALGRIQLMTFGMNQLMTLGRNQLMMLRMNQLMTLGMNHLITLRTNQLMTVGRNQSMTLGRNQLIEIQYCEYFPLCWSKKPNKFWSYYFFLSWRSFNSPINIMKTFVKEIQSKWQNGILILLINNVFFFKLWLPSYLFKGHTKFWLLKCICIFSMYVFCIKIHASLSFLQVCIYIDLILYGHIVFLTVSHGYAKCTV